MKRGYGLTQVARLSGLGVGTIGNWEADRRTPSGPALERLLTALDLPVRSKARLISELDPAHARIALAHTDLGPPTEIGTILRAVRESKRVTQAELAHRLGVAQGTVAKWEGGDSVPTPETLHALGWALGFTPEETMALARVRGVGSAGFAHDPGSASDELYRALFHVPLELRRTVLLGWEAETWRRAVRDERWESTYVYTLAARANQDVLDDRFDEIPTLFRRVMRLAKTVEARTYAVPGIGAMASVAQRRGEPPEETERAVRSWAEKIPDSPYRAWLFNMRGIRLAKLGRAEEGVDVTLRARDMDDYGIVPDRDTRVWIRRVESIGEVYLAAGQAEKSAEAIGGRREPDFDQLLYARVEHANERPLGETEMAFLRVWIVTSGNAYPMKRRILAEIEQEQARLTGEAPVALPLGIEPTGDLDREAERLWSGIVGRASPDDPSL